MAKKTGSLPHYKLKVYDRVTEKHAYVGAGWLNKNGSITISLNLCTVLTQHENLAITLFPNDSTDFPHGHNKEETESEEVVKKGE